MALNGNDFPICPDYDEDCLDIEDPMSCFLGGTYMMESKNRCIIFECGIAQGLCPVMERLRNES